MCMCKDREYAMDKFGEFPWSCKSGKVGTVIGVPTFVPPAGFDAQWLRENAEYDGRSDLDGKPVDVFRVKADSKASRKEAKLMFLVGTDLLLRVEQTVSDNKGDFLYVMNVHGIASGKQSPSLFEVPPGARC